MLARYTTMHYEVALCLLMLSMVIVFAILGTVVGTAFGLMLARYARYNTTMHDDVALCMLMLLMVGWLVIKNLSTISSELFHDSLKKGI